MRTIRSVKGQTDFGQAEASLAYAAQGLRLGRMSTKKNKRKAKAQQSTQAFCETYLSHHFRKGFCELHFDIFAAVDAAPNDPDSQGVRMVRVAPRKFGKTTIISLGVPLKKLAYQEKFFVLLIGESDGTAQTNLGSIVQEIENNEALQEDFPHLVPARDPKGQLVKWTDEEIILANYAIVRAKGIGSRMRGMKYRNRRPDLAVLDDPESPETADTFLKRRRHKRWFGGTFLGLGATGWDIYVISNLPHHDCLSADLVKSKKWDGKLYRAINIPKREDERYPIGNTRFDNSPLWPEVWPQSALDAYKAEPTVGSLGFSREMMNDPREEEDKIFDLDRFTYFDFNPDDVRREYATLAVAVDPAGGEKQGDFKRGVRDWCSIVVGGRRKQTGIIDIFDVELTKKPPEEQIKLLLDVLKRWGIRTVGVEENMFKNLYGPSIIRMARESGVYPGVFEIQNTTNKMSRIQGIQPVLHNGTVRFARNLIETKKDFFSQFDEFPAQYDDGPDGVEMLIRLLEFKYFGSAPLGIGSTPSYWKPGSN